MFCFGKLPQELQNFHSHPSRPILNPTNLTPVTWAWWVSEGAGQPQQLSVEHGEGCDMLMSLLFWWLGKYHTRLHHFTLAAILALEFEEKREYVGKRERQGYEGPGDGKLAHYQSSPCFSGAVFKYCCALCHCFTKAIMLSSLRWHQRQRAPTIYCTTTTASMKACSSYVQRNGSGYFISPP